MSKLKLLNIKVNNIPAATRERAKPTIIPDEFGAFISAETTLKIAVAAFILPRIYQNILSL